MIGCQTQTGWAAAVTFDHFITGNATVFQARQAWMAYWVNRNNSFATNGICAISRSFERTVGSNEFQYLARGLISNENYR
jgi:hypothetical protein